MNLNEWHWNAIASKKIRIKNKTSFFQLSCVQKNKPMHYGLCFENQFQCSIVCTSLFFFWSFSRCSVLVFPPLNSYRRFLIHKLCEKFNTLGSFSISQGNDRRVVIYSRTNTQLNQTNTNSLASDGRWVFQFFKGEFQQVRGISKWVNVFNAFCYFWFFHQRIGITKVYETVNIRKTKIALDRIKHVIKWLHQRWA